MCVERERVERECGERVWRECVFRERVCVDRDFVWRESLCVDRECVFEKRVSEEILHGVAVLRFPSATPCRNKLVQEQREEFSQA